MNERIQELALEAFQPINDITTEGVADRNTFDQAWFQLYNQKFAELIVQECVNICDDVQWQYGQYTFTATEVKNRVRERFGVEEQEKVVLKCSVCGTTEKVKYLGGYQAYLCDSVDCIPL